MDETHLKRTDTRWALKKKRQQQQYQNKQSRNTYVCGEETSGAEGKRNVTLRDEKKLSGLNVRQPSKVEGKRFNRT